MFWLLLGAGVIGVLSTIPSALTAQAELLKDIPVPLWIILPVQTIQNAVLIGIAVALGLWLGKKIGLGAPLITAWLNREAIGARLRPILAPSIICGVLIAVAIIALDVLIFAKYIPDVSSKIKPTRLWQDLLTIVYGGITEELLMRLGLFTVIAWALHRIRGGTESRPRSSILWIANIITALIFGLGHLPAMAMLVPITVGIVVRSIALNGIGGLVFGVLYWRYGLEAAMLAHLSGDLILVTASRLLNT